MRVTVPAARYESGGNAAALQIRRRLSSNAFRLDCGSDELPLSYRVPCTTRVLIPRHVVRAAPIEQRA
jgi:hypothetical protein